MAWIESHQSLSRHRKTLEAVALLRVDRHKFIGHLHELWWWGLDNANTDGQLGQVPSRTLANAAGWPIKDADRFTDALVAAGFIEQTEDGYMLHDWFDYVGKLSLQRELRRESNRAAQSARRQRLRQQHVSMTVADSQQPTVPNRTNQPDQPTNRTDAADAASSRARDGGGGDEDEGFVSRHVEQRCPIAPHTFSGDYGQHLATDERHQRLPPPAPVGLRSIGSLLPAEVRQRLNQPPIGGDEHADG